MKAILNYILLLLGIKKQENEPPVVPIRPEPVVVETPVQPIVVEDVLDPPTDFENAVVDAFLWKPVRDHGPEPVVVAWSANINSKDLVIEVTNRNSGTIRSLGKTDFTPPSHYVRGANVHGKYGGINFQLNTKATNLPTQIIVKAKVKLSDGSFKYVKIGKYDQIQITAPTVRIEVNYKTNNYRKYGSVAGMKSIVRTKQNSTLVKDVVLEKPTTPKINIVQKSIQKRIRK
jgi:hypothetical protein